MKITLKLSTLMLLLATAVLITAFFPAFVWPRISAFDQAGFEVFALTAVAGFCTFLIVCNFAALLFESFLADALGTFAEGTVPSIAGAGKDKDGEKHVI